MRRSNSLFSVRRGSLFGPQKKSNNTSPPSCSKNNNAVIQAELNDYLGCILRCLSKYFVFIIFNSERNEKVINFIFSLSNFSTIIILVSYKLGTYNNDKKQKK